MKKLYILLYLFTAYVCSPFSVSAQCPASHPYSAQINWDNLDYYYNSGLNGNPYGYRVSGTNYTYVTDAMERTQKFAFGTNVLTIATSANGMVDGENGTHTGNLAGFTGDDAQFGPTANNQTITLTFDVEIRNFTFTLYDVDGGQRINFLATNTGGTQQNINMTVQGGSTVTRNNNGATNAYVTSTATNQGTGSNNGTVTVSVTDLKQFTMTIQTIGTDPVFWMSDINGCVATPFPANWHQLANNRPFWGPVTSQPDYFLVTPDNDSCYMADPVGNTVRAVFRDNSRDYINTFAYDPYNKYLYYISENTSVDYTNKVMKRYDFTAESSSTILADITSLNIPTFSMGIESAAAAFYDGCLYVGIEGGRYGNDPYTTRESIVYRISFTGATPTSACQVCAFPAYDGTGYTSIHDWGDFVIKNGMLYNFNTARNSPGANYTQSKYHHFNLQTSNMDAVYNNPAATEWNGQGGMCWNENMYYFKSNGIGAYNGAGVNGPVTTPTVVGGGGWPGGAGDASDPFRPKCDFGDAPASYDPYATPATQSPAVHERSDNIRLGATWDREWLKRGTSGTDDVDDGLPFVQYMPPGPSSYYFAQVSVHNTSGANATLIAWLDYNNNGTFEASEAGQVIPAGPIPTGGTVSRYLYWPGFTTPLTIGQSTYLRIRVTSTSNGMTTSHPTGYFPNGEVEDYRVPVDNFPLASKLVDFNALLQDRKVKLDWKVAEETGIYAYEIEKSRDNLNWVSVGVVNAHNTSGTFNYVYEDPNPFTGNSYYRLKLLEGSGMPRFSDIRPVTIKDYEAALTVTPNPVKDVATLRFETSRAGDLSLDVLNVNGVVIYSRKENVISGLNTIQLQLPKHIASGSYVVRAVIGNETIYKKFIVNR